MPTRRLLGVLVAATTLWGSALATAAPASVCPSQERIRPLAVTTLCLINEARVRHGASRLRPDRRLRTAARRHSRDMVAHRYLSHDSRSGRSFVARIARTGWMRGRRRWKVGETIAWHRAPATPRSIVRAWLRSAPHRHVLLDPRLRVVGIGIVSGTPFGSEADGATYTADFGS